MGYFSNSTEGMMFEEHFCARCRNFKPLAHDPSMNTCPVLELHMLWNYDQCGKDERAKEKKTALEMFIPEVEPGIMPECRMFEPISQRHFLEMHGQQRLNIGPRS